jgi:hypothetical protein
MTSLEKEKFETTRKILKGVIRTLETPPFYDDEIYEVVSALKLIVDFTLVMPREEGAPHDN